MNLVVGEALIDIVYTDGSQPIELPGGSPLNVAVGLARLGRRASLVTSVGNDIHGRILAAYASGAAVDLWPGSITNDIRTSTAKATLDASGNAAYEFDLTWQPPSPPQPHTPEMDAVENLHPRVIHTGSLAAQLPSGFDTVTSWLDLLHPTATVTFDPNFRPDIDTGGADTVAMCEEIVKRADVVKMSVDDLAHMYPGADYADVAREWLGRGVGLVAVTRGNEGAHMFSTVSDVEIDPVDVTVVDTVGAGDAFMSALIDALGRTSMLGSGARDELGDLSAAKLRTVGRYANAAGAITVSRRGAVPPSRDELLQYANQYGSQV